MRLPFGETITARRWAAWRAGVAVGDPQVWNLSGVAFAPAGPAADPAGRRGHVVPTATMLLGYRAELAPHDLIERPGGALFEVTGPVERFRSPLTGWEAGATAAVTEIVATGPESVRIFPSVESEDGYGTPTRRPSATGTVVDRVSVEPLPAPEDASSGQEADARYRLTGAGLTMLDAFGEVEWPVDSGRRFDVTGVPVHWPWPPSASYTQATLRERT